MYNFILYMSYRIIRIKNLRKNKIKRNSIKRDETKNLFGWAGAGAGYNICI
jgi:hypothetical protein